MCGEIWGQMQKNKGQDCEPRGKLCFGKTKEFSGERKVGDGQSLREG